MPSPLRSIDLTVLVLLSCGGTSSFCQTQAPQRVMPPVVPSAIQDPTRPEVQPRLDVDRDPIPSLDPDVTESVSANSTVNTSGSANASTPSTPGKSGELQKLPNGMYTMHAEVDEVLLDCTVIDDKGRTVSGLERTDFRVWEDGVQQTINSVQHQDVPVSMGILVDNSGSMRDKRGS